LNRALVLVLVAGCSVVNDPDRHRGAPSDGGLPPIAAGDACDEVALVMCGAYETCCPTRTETREECETRVLARCEQTIEPYLLDPRTGYGEARAAEVLLRARELASSCDTDIAQFFVYDLLTILEGTNPRGGVCITLAQALDNDFAGIFSCRRSDELVCRPREAPLGDWICQGESAEGGACNNVIHCERGLYCVGGSFLATGTCMPQLRNGTACVTSDQCQSLNCLAMTCQPIDESIYCTDLFPDPDGGMMGKP
jgi:hypothetical protein